ncbi:ABC transporter substrate-binding protein [Pseudoponticoccus marisrubri]|uniref:Peptide ABC transporter n=1 Tax=Pseudoponticoccus marisrubri TaxID=1685382 RepID=A0A0W7WMQ1_9RHOB|nr:ABC transporter substrate-binding protein [Pseudoponticoccus marisrubri]KUF11809.1 peptide ABC transporter [Pseudoponticoccus marisrubri]
MRPLTGLLTGVAITVLALPAFARDVTIDLTGEPSSLDPHMQWNPDSYYVYRNIFDNVVTRDNDGAIVPQIATEWNYASETELVLTIRDGVTFHDGEPLTAEDVAFSVNRIIDPEFGSPQLGQFNQIEMAEVMEGNKVKLTTKGPYPALLAQLVKLSVVPQHIVEEVGKDAFNEAPVGSGPYSFEDWNRGVSVTLAKNDSYWGEDGPFDNAVFRAVPDAATRIANLQAGTADLVVGLDSDGAMQLAGNPAVKALSTPTERVAFMGMNLDKPPFSDPELRRAASLAIDSVAIAEGLLGAGEVPMAQLSSPAHFGYAPDIAPFEYDPEQAAEIVASKSEMAATPATFATAPVFDQRVVQALQQMLNDVGFNISISMTDMPTYLAAARAPDRAERPELNFGRWSCACQDADGIAYPLLHSGSSWSRVSNAELDALLEEARTSLDENVRLAAYEKVHQIVRDDYLVRPIYQAAVLYGARAELEFEPTANESMFLNRMSWSE